VRKPALACLSICLLFGAGAAVYAQQSSSQASAPASHAPDQAKPGSKPAETPQAALETPAEKHSTPEDRQRLVTVAHKLEAAPLDPVLAQDRDWAMSWVVAAPDIHVRICPSLLADLRRPKYKYRSEIAAQLLISSAAFLIEHPDQADGIAPQSVGGMEGVLKAYSAILKTDPQATAKSLDNFLQKQSEGKLAAAVREEAKDCH
jgi:hypothetical protein